MFKINIDKLLNKIIVVLCIIIVISGFGFIKEYKNASRTYKPDPDYLMMLVSDKEYSELSGKLYRYYLDNPKGELKECIAVGNYYKNTAFYKMYERVGNEERAKKYLALIDDTTKDMGDLSFVVDDINKELENYANK